MALRVKMSTADGKNSASRISCASEDRPKSAMSPQTRSRSAWSTRTGHSWCGIDSRTPRHHEGSPFGLARYAAAGHDNRAPIRCLPFAESVG